MKKILSVALIISAVVSCAAEGTCSQKSSLSSGPITYEPASVSPGFAYNPKFDRIIEKYAHQKNLDPFLIKCLIKVESDYNPNAVSPAGAAGLMQLMQETAWHYGVTDRTDPESNIRAGIFHLSSLLVSFHGDVSLALAAYHAGGGRVKKNMAVPPIQATIDYVNLIMYYYSGEKDYIRKYNKMLRSEDFIMKNVE